LIRVEHALKSLLQQATSRKSKCVAVVTHSTYLRMLLAVAQEQPLLLASTMEQKNCCINVVDIQTDGSTRKFIGLDSPLFTSVGGGMFSKVPTIADFGLTIPVCQVVRINEKRHLVGLV
jgi:broad specificity phosphatase PhoE